MNTETQDAEREPADVIAEEFAERMRRGERPSVSEYTARHPDLAEQLNDLLPAVAQMEQLKRFRKTPAQDSRPDRLGDFRIIREVGRGGMGLVFEAVQESLGRPVALKLLARHALFEPSRRSRFLREAQAAAKLHHTNIVPVFGVGEQDDMPYYVMQLIPGCGLHTLVARWQVAQQRHGGGSTVQLRGPHADTDATNFSLPPPSDVGPPHRDWAFIARVGAEAADALQYAHKQGVLHRDIKPGNLLLDNDGRTWVTDFGLAKQTHELSLTATGDVVGTLQYMPPEFLNGQADARSDVYSLGATLYELLTLRPPFDAPTPAGIIKQLTERDVTHPRDIEPNIPRDLETIVLTAMAREPARRYQSAREMKEDLEAFLEDRPIRARRISAVARGWRLCRRNPVVAALTLTTTLAVLFALGFGWVSYARTKQALEREEHRRGEAEQATAKLQKNLQLSLDAFDDLFRASEETDGWGGPFSPGGPDGGFGRGINRRPDGMGRGPDGPGRGPDNPGPGPGVGPFNGGRGSGPPVPFAPAESLDSKAVVLEQVLAFYDKFAEQNATNSQLQFEAAKARRRVGELHNRLDQSEKAAAAFRRAGMILDELHAQYPQSADILAELVVANAHSPDYPKTPAGREEAERRWKRAADLGQTGPTDDPRFTMPVVDAYIRLGLARQEANDPAGEEAWYRAALKWLTERKVDAHAPPKVFVQARVVRLLADVLHRQHRYPEARQLLEGSINDLLPYLRNGPNENRMIRPVLSELYQRLAEFLRQAGDARGMNQALAAMGQLQGPRSDGPRDGRGPGGRPFDGPPPGGGPR